MGKKVANIIEIIIEVVALVIFFTMQGTTTLRIAGVYQNFDGAIYKTLHMVPVYAVIFYALWALNLIICVVSVISKDSRKDGLIHSILTILLFFATDFIILSFTSTMNHFLPLQAFMALLVVSSFVKRANILNPEH